MKFPIHLVLFFFFSFTTSWSISQSESIEPNPNGYWLSYLGDNKLNKRLGIHSEMQLRSVGVSNAVKSGILRVGANIYLKPYAMATLGYAYIYSVPSVPNLNASEVIEHRSWQQLILRQKSHAIFMEHRYRLEQRFLNDKTQNISKVAYRSRYRFQVLLPLYSVSPTLRHFFIASNNEIMLSFRKNPSEVFDRNRFFSGIGYQVSPKLNFQLGYLNQFAHNKSSEVAMIDHIVQFGFSYNMDDLMPTFLKKTTDK
jgi:hypothetical protein